MIGQSLRMCTAATVVLLVAGTGCSTSEHGPCGLGEPGLSADGTLLVVSQLFCDNAFVSLAGDSLLVSSVRAAELLYLDLQTGEMIGAFDAAPSVFSCRSGICGYVMSPDGRRFAPGMVEGNRIPVLDVQTGTVQEYTADVSDGSNGAAVLLFPSDFSADGKYLAFGAVVSISSFEQTSRPYLLDIESDTIEAIALSNSGEVANAMSYGPLLSGDARIVTFVSEADNLIEGDQNGLSDVFVRDRQTGQTDRMSIASDGSEAAVAGREFPGEVAALSISADGRFVLFLHPAANLAGGDMPVLQQRDPELSILYLRDRQEGQTTVISAYGNPFARLSSDGRIAVHVDSDGAAIIRNIETGNEETIRFEESEFLNAPASISADGCIVALGVSNHSLGPAQEPGAPQPRVLLYDCETGTASEIRAE